MLDLSCNKRRHYNEIYFRERIDQHPNGLRCFAEIRDFIVDQKMCLSGLKGLGQGYLVTAPAILIR